MEVFTRDRLEILKNLYIQGLTLPRNVQLEQNAQLLQSKNLAARFSKIPHLLGWLTGKYPSSLDEVRYVYH
ncbi:hypothetical protein [Nostoc sp. FACHB-280]|uniref:hypothetical protein n=1 Tax=Nostoc sp. FACHB-280 TaxID=2692839 RepID=UPI00168B2643|nr:hypothetical protein [Nostoc sp. FACHB-280]MBD2495874.1 hypothetical protein [Nostoc sp. FACHB-280]